MSSVLPYDPGLVPSKPAPSKGEVIEFSVEGLPPYKDLSQSIRNSKHKAHDRFKLIRQMCSEAMNGRAWSSESIALQLIVFGCRDKLDRSLNDYLSGICDSLDGSSGPTFTYLPIAFEDDSQVYDSWVKFTESEKEYYKVRITFGDNAA